MNKCVLLLLCSIFIGNNLFSQNYRYKKFKQELNLAPFSNIDLLPEFKNKDIVKLYDSTLFQISNLESYPRAIITKTLRIKFLTAEGVKSHSNLILPNIDDPGYDNYYVNDKKRGLVPRPLHKYIDINYFYGRVSSKGNEIKKLEWSDKTIKEVHTNSYSNVLNVYNYQFQFSGIKIGDEVEIKYKYTYDISRVIGQNRYFFYSKIPTQATNFIFKYPHNEYHLIFKCFNGAYPVDSFKREEKPFYSTLTWNCTNLPVFQSNQYMQKLYKSVPYFTYYFHKKDYGDTKPLLSGGSKIIKYQPYTWAYYIERRLDYYFRQRIKDKEKHVVLDKSTLAIMHFYKELTIGIEEETALTKMLKIHNTINNDFKFSDDIAYLTGKDKFLPRINRFLPEKIFRNISRYNIYSELLEFNLNVPYYKMLVQDNRISSIDINNYNPIMAYTILYALENNNSIYFFFPKAHRYGYEMNELPFYWEGEKALLIPQNISIDSAELQAQFITLPKSNEATNIRSNLILVNVRMEDSTLLIKSKLSLSGQYSTLTRGNSLYNYIDTSINPNYYKKLFNDIEGAQILNSDLKSHIETFPFKTNFVNNYMINNALRKIDSNLYEIDLQSFFNHVILDDYNSEESSLPYYSDFRAKDIIKYYFKFEEEINLPDTNLFYEIKNKFGEYNFKITKISANTILVESIYSVLSDVVNTNDLSDINDIYSAIKETNKSILCFSLLSKQ